MGDEIMDCKDFYDAFYTAEQNARRDHMVHAELQKIADPIFYALDSQLRMRSIPQHRRDIVVRLFDEIQSGSLKIVLLNRGYTDPCFKFLSSFEALATESSVIKLDSVWSKSPEELAITLIKEYEICCGNGPSPASPLTRQDGAAKAKPV